jgi:F-type H+-transporting ATPase subunit delta
MASTAGIHDIARRYATAFFELAQEQSQIDQIAKDMDSVAGLVAASEDFGAFIADATLRREDQVDAVLAVAKHMKLSALTEKFLGLLAAKRRLPVLPEIAEAVKALIADHRGEMTAEIIAAQALDQTQISEIAAHLKKALGKEVRINLQIDSRIMGGIIIKVGSKLMDSSVRTKLERLHRALRNPNEPSAQKKMKEVA